MMFKSKKGVLTMIVLVKIIVVLVSFMLIAGTLARFASKLEPRKAELVCRQSVDTRVASTTNIELYGGNVKDIKYSPFLCKTIDREISGTKDEVMDQMAEMVTRCWWMFRKGQTANLFQTLAGTGGDNKGMVCYTALIEEIEGDEKEFTGNEFLYYLRDKKHPELKKSEGSYLDYIQYSSGGNGRLNLLLTDSGNKGIGTFKEGYGYEIAFIEKSAEKNEWISSFLLGAGGLTATVGATVLVVATGGTALLVGSALVGGGLVAATEGTSIKIDEFFKEVDVSTIMIVDMSNQKLREELHRNVFIKDIAGK